MKMLVTGATGKLGSEVVETLLKSVSTNQLVVSVRKPEKAEWLKERGIEVRQGDFDDLNSLEKAFSGIDRLLIISADGDNETRIRQHKNAVAAAKQAKVGFIAYTSLANAMESNMFLAPPHQAAEQAIVESGIPYSFLRNNWYLENETASIQGVMAGAPWVTAAGDGRVGWALHREYAEAAAAVLAHNGHENTIYELSGPLVRQAELAAIVGELLNKEVKVQHVDDNTYADIMKSVGVPEPVVPFLVDIQKGIRDKALEVESNDFEKLLGRPLTPLKEAINKVIQTI